MRIKLISLKYQAKSSADYKHAAKSICSWFSHNLNVGMCFGKAVRVGMPLIIPHLFLFSNAQSKDFTSSLTTKSHHCDLQAPGPWESQNICERAAGQEDSDPGSRPALTLKEEKTPVSLSYLQTCRIPSPGRQRRWDH